MVTWNICWQSTGWKSFYTFLLLWYLVYCMRVHIYFCLSLQQILAGVDDLQQVKALEMRVDTREISLGNFGKKTLYFLLTILNFPLLWLDWGLTNQQPVKSTVLLKSSWNRISLVYLTLFDLCLVWGSQQDWKFWQWDEWHDFCLKPISLNKFFLYDVLGPKWAFTLVSSETGAKGQLLSTVRFPCDWRIASGIRWLVLLAACLCTLYSLTELCWKMSWRQVL